MPRRRSNVEKFLKFDACSSIYFFVYVTFEYDYTQKANRFSPVSRTPCPDLATLKCPSARFTFLTRSRNSFAGLAFLMIPSPPGVEANLISKVNDFTIYRNCHYLNLMVIDRATNFIQRSVVVLLMSCIWAPNRTPLSA